MDLDFAPQAVSIDLFGTLVAIEDGVDPVAAIDAELRARGIDVPEDWGEAYGERHVAVAAGEEVPLPIHVRGALASRGISMTDDRVEDDGIEAAASAAFDVGFRPRAGAAEILDVAGGRAPLGILSNCSVSGLVERAMATAGRLLGLSPGWTYPYEGRELAPAGINIVAAGRDERMLVTADIGAVVNVNTRSNAALAERLL